MKLKDLQNIIVDEANQVTYGVMAKRQLTDGEVCSSIRAALLLCRAKQLHRGETLKIGTARWD